MIKVKKWLHNKRKEEAASAEKPRAARATFLELPGEIRNQIYAYSIYPNLSSILVANCTKPEHLAATVLRVPLFRTCRQIRAETLSYLCATFQLSFLGLQTAVSFFSFAGDAASEVKSLVLNQPVLGMFEDGKSRGKVEQFFSALEAMSELSEVRLEGPAGLAISGQSDGYLAFVKRLEKLRERNVVVHVK